jgi:transcription termination/antitermination protein NusA
MSSNTENIKELIEIICAEKGLEIDEVILAIENAIASAYRREFGKKENAYQVSFNLEKGTYNVSQIIAVVDEVINPFQQISVVEARLSNPRATVGDIIKTDIDTDQNVEFGRIASQIAKQVLFQSINNARHSKILQQFKDKIGDIVNVEVDYFNKGGYSVKLGQTNGYISREHLLPVDKFKSGTIIKALIVDIVEDSRNNSKIILSRTDVNFIKAIIKNEIPEVENGLVNIDKIVREPGFKSKVLVSAQEGEDIDPVGTILGKKNMRIFNIMRQISTTMQEKIDIIENQPEELDLMIMDALEPAQIDRVNINYEEKKADVYCSKEAIVLAVGKRGVNARLAERLLDLQINIIAEENDSTDFQMPNKNPTIILD